MTPIFHIGDDFLDAHGVGYAVVQSLPCDGGGQAYLVQEQRASLQQIVKVFPAVGGGGARQHEESFLRAVMALQRPGLSAFHESGQRDGAPPYILFSAPRGEPLPAYIGRFGPLSVVEAVDVVGQLGDELIALGGLGCAHPRLSPEAISLSTSWPTSDGSAETPQQSATLVCYGLRLEPVARGSADSGAAGCEQTALAELFLYLVTGTASADAAGQLSSLTDLPAGLPAVLRQALQPEPARRWPSLSAFLSALRQSPPADVPPSPALATYPAPKKNVRVASPTATSLGASQPLALPGLGSYLLLMMVVLLVGGVTARTLQPSPVESPAPAGVNSPPTDSPSQRTASTGTVSRSSGAEPSSPLAPFPPSSPTGPAGSPSPAAPPMGGAVPPGRLDLAAPSAPVVAVPAGGGLDPRPLTSSSSPSVNVAPPPGPEPEPEPAPPIVAHPTALPAPRGPRFRIDVGFAGGTTASPSVRQQAREALQTCLTSRSRAAGAQLSGVRIGAGLIAGCRVPLHIAPAGSGYQGIIIAPRCDLPSPVISSLERCLSAQLSRLNLSPTPNRYELEKLP